MTNQPRRGSLSRERRSQCVDAARKDLSEFLSGLDPVLRKYLEEPGLTPDEARQVWLQVSPDREEQRKAAVERYERLLIQIPEDWRRYCRRIGPPHALLKEWVLLGRLRRGGAPKKPWSQREDTIIGEK